YSFFFSSRRRHTRSKRDWSSDVCSSDLEHQCSPVVHLTDEQAAADLEGDIESGHVGAGHLHTVEWEVGTVVDDLGDRGIEEQGQVDTSQDQDDEAVESDLTQEEGPVGREDLVDLAADSAGHGVAGIKIVSHCS